MAATIRGIYKRLGYRVKQDFPIKLALLLDLVEHWLPGIAEGGPCAYDIGASMVQACISVFCLFRISEAMDLRRDMFRLNYQHDDHGQRCTHPVAGQCTCHIAIDVEGSKTNPLKIQDESTMVILAMAPRCGLLFDHMLKQHWARQDALIPAGAPDVVRQRCPLFANRATLVRSAARPPPLPPQKWYLTRLRQAVKVLKSAGNPLLVHCDVDRDIAFQSYKRGGDASMLDVPEIPRACIGVHGWLAKKGRSEWEKRKKRNMVDYYGSDADAFLSFTRRISVTLFL